MTTLICDFQDIVGKKIDGYATLTAGKVRPSYDSPSLVVHNPTKQRVDAGQTTFVNVNPGEAVITLEWDEQSATIRFVVPESDDAVYLSDCLSGEYLDPDELELLRWSIQNQLSGAREILETAKNLGLTEINGSTEAYFTEAAEILRKALEAAQLAEQALETIDDKVAGTEGVVTDVDEAKQKIQDLLDELATLELELGGTNADLAGAVETINTLSPQVDAATQAASAATQKAQNAVNELSAVQDANAAEFIEIKKDLDSATQTAKQATDAVAQTNQQLGLEVQRILGEVAVSLDTANEATNQARIANDNLETYQYQLGEIQQEQAHIIGQQAEIVGNYGSYTAELDRISAEIATAASELDTISGEQSALVTEMNTQVGSLQELTALQGAAINAAKQVADTANSKADTAQATVDNLQIGGRNLAFGTAEEKVKTMPGNSTLRFPVNASAVQDAVGKVLTLSFDARSDVEDYTGDSYIRNDADAIIATSFGNFSVTTEKRRYEFQVEAKPEVLDTDKLSLTIRSFIPGTMWISNVKLERGTKATDWTPAPEDVAADVAKAQSEAETARAEATSKSDAARVAAELYAKEQAEAAQADAEVEAARAALEIAQREAQAAQDAAAEDATSKANAARTAAETLAKAEAKAAKEAAEATAALDASTKANNAKEAAEAKAATLATAAKDAAATALTGYKNLNDPKVSKAQGDATKGINAAAAAQTAADQAKADATSKSAAAKTAAEKYAKEAAEAAQAQAEENAAAEALRVAQAEATAAKNAAATDAQAKADEAERLAKIHADAQAKTAKEQAEATAAKDAATKADNARIAAEANAKVLSDKAQQAANAAQSSIDNLEIGGRNLLYKSSEWKFASSDNSTTTDRSELGKLKVLLGTSSWNAYWWITGLVDEDSFFDGKSTYTVSVEFRVTSPGGGEVEMSFDVRNPGGSVRRIVRSDRITDTQGKWVRASATIVLPNAEERRALFALRGYNTSPGDLIEYRNAKIERGTKATDWTPAPEDIDANVAKAQAEAELARSEATSKSNAARVAAEKYAKEQAEAVQADAEVEAARVALEIAQREAKAAQDAAAKDATSKANAARTAAETLAKAEAKAAKESAEATAAADASTKANKAKTDAEAKAATLATAAQNAAATALSTYKGQNDPKVTKAQKDASSGITKADAAKKQADKGVTDAATALARANEANNKLPAITADVSAAAQTALEAVNALPGIRTDISTAKKQADKGVQDAATAKTAVDNLQIGGRNYFLNSGGAGAPVSISSNHNAVYPITQGEDENGAWIQGAYADGSGWMISSYTNPTYDRGYGTNYSEAFKDVPTPYTQSIEVMCMEAVRVSIHGGESVDLTPGVWTRIHRTLTTDSRTRPSGITASRIGDIPESTRLYHRHWKMEAGTRATDWTPAPEDVDAGITTAQTTAETARTEATNKANKALQDATTALTNYQKVNDPKVTTAKSTADKGVSDAATAKSAADTAKARADKGVSDAATAKARADKGVTDAATAKSAADTAKQRADKGVTDAATAKSAADVAKQQADQGVADAAAVREAVRIIDTRSVEHPPSYYWGKYPMTPVKEFTRENTLGISNTTAYITLETTIPWTDSSGGAIVQRASRGAGSGKTRVLTRTSIGSRDTAYWSDWVNEMDDLNNQISTLNTKAGELTIGLSNAATQKDYNDLNTQLWGGQGAINKLQGDINANNSAFQTWQKTINDQQKKWNDASTNATAALARFAITQSQWNDISGKATNANTKAIAAHAALFDGQNKWNEVAAAAIAAQATLLAKQDLWNAAQQDVNTKQGRWNDAAKEILDSTGKFQKLQKQFNADQKLWNATQNLVNDSQKGINALNNKTNTAQDKAIEANTSAIKALAKIDTGESLVAYLEPTDAEVKNGTAKYDVPVWTTAAHREFSGSNAPPSHVKYAFGASSTDGTKTAKTVPVTVRPGTKYILSFWAYGSGKLVIYMYGNGGGYPIRFTRQLKVNQDTLQIEKDAGGRRIYDPAGNGNSSNVNGTQWLLNGFKPDQLYKWVHYKFEVEFTEPTTEVWFNSFYWNWNEKSVYGQYLGGLQFYPDVPTQADVDEAQNKALQALNRFTIDQAAWNKTSGEATTALAAGQAAQEELSKKRGDWEKGATLAINNLQSTSTKFQQWTNGATLALNNLQTTSTKFKQWTDGATLAINNLQATSAKFKQWTKAATEAQDALQAVVGLPGDNFNGTLIGQVSNLGAELDHRLRDVNEEIQTLQSNHWMTHYWSKSGGNWHGNDWFNVTRNSNGSVNITAKGTWVGEATVNAVRNQTLPGELSKAMHTPFQWQWGIDTNRTYTLPTPGPYGTEEVISLIINFRVNPGTAVNQPYSTRDYVPAENNWRTLWTHTVPAATSVSAELHVGWDAATNGDKYGIRILVDGVQRAVDGPRTGVGPLTPLGNGYRTMDVSVKGQSIAAGKTVQFQVQTTGNTTARRKIRDARANVQYKY